MAKNINHLQHVKSSVVENGAPKLPTPSVLVEGELAVNYAADYETISLKNSSGDVVTFSSDHYYTEKHLGSGFTGENSAVTVTQAINESEKVAAAALNDLNERKLDASAYTEPDLSEYATKEWVDEERLGSGFTGENSGRTVTEEFDEMEIVVSAALNDLNERKLDASAYTETDLSDYYTMGEVDDLLDEKADLEHVHPISAITGLQDALDDKQDVLTFDDKPTSGSSNPVTSHGIYSAMADTELVIAAALNDLDDRKLDASAYTSSIGDFYTKEQVDSKLGADFSGTDYAQSVTEVINTVETVTAAALNDLNSRKLDASAYTPTDLTGYATEQWVTGITTPLRNDVNTLSGNAITSATYSSTTKEIVFTTSTGKTIVIDATDFIKDGMVNEVAVDEPTSGSNSGVTCLIITFNTDAGREDIEIPISEIFDSGLYYTKEEIDNVLGSGFTVSSVTSSITEVIKENELITASALNDLNLRKLDASAYTETDLSGYYTKVEVDDKLGSGFTGENSGYTVTKAMNDTERVVAAALNDLNERKLDASAFTESVGDFYTKSEIDDFLGDWFTSSSAVSSVTNVIEENELIISQALNDLDERILEISGSSGSGGGSSVMLPIGGYFDFSDPRNSTLDFSNYTFDELSGMAANNQDIALIDEGGYVYRLSNIKYSQGGTILIFVGDNFYETGRNFYVMFPAIGVFNNGGLAYECILLEPQTSGGGGTGDLSGVTFNDDATHRLVTDTEKSTWNGKQDALQYYSETNTGDAIIQTESNIYESGSNTGYIQLVSFDSATYQPLSRLLLENTSSKLECGYPDSTRSSYVECSSTGTVLDFKADNTENKVVLDSVGFKYNNNTVATTNLIPTALSALTADATHRLVTDTEKTSWNNAANDRHVHGNLSVLEGITSQKVTNWDNAYTSAHSHSNKSVLDGITTTKVGNWDDAATNAHNHDNKAILDNLTQTVIDNSHTHNNKTVLDGITTAKTAQWDNAISAVSFNGTDATVTNHKAAITATIPTSLSQLTSAHTHAISEVTNLQSTLNAKVSGITVNNGSKVTPTNGVANLTINASTVGAMASGTTLDGIADGTTRKLSDYATTGTVNTHTGNTAIHLPAVTAADNGKILMVVNGQWALVNPTTIYTGTGTPSSSQGNDGDIYLQTS